MAAKRVKEIVRKSGEQRRHELLDAGLEIFLDKGYEDTTVDDIVEKVGVAKGTFYIYFKSKEEFYGDLFDRFVDQTLGLLYGALGDEELKAWERIDRVYEVVRETVSDYADHLVLFHRISSDPEYARRQLETNMKIVQGLQLVIEQGISEGTMEAKDPEIAAFFLVCVAWQSAHDAIALGLPLPLEEILPHIYKFVIDYLTPLE